MLAGDQLRQIFALLRFGAVAADLVHAEIGVGAVGERHRGRGAAHLLHRHAVFEIAQPGAAVFLLDGDAEQAEFAQLRPELAREFVRPVDLGGARRDLVWAKAATVSRIIAAVSPRSNTKSGERLAIMRRTITGWRGTETPFTIPETNHKGNLMAAVAAEAVAKGKVVIGNIGMLLNGYVDRPQSDADPSSPSTAASPASERTRTAIPSGPTSASTPRAPPSLRASSTAMCIRCSATGPRARTSSAGSTASSWRGHLHGLGRRGPSAGTAQGCRRRQGARHHRPARRFPPSGRAG